MGKRELLLGLFLGMLLALLPWPVPARADSGVPGAPCHPEWLAGAPAEAVARVEHDGRTHTRVTVSQTVHAPAAWPLADDLLLGPGSAGYRQAMACLLREEQDSDASYRVYTRWEERRTAPPVVVQEASGVRVEFSAYAWMDVYASGLSVGPWRVDTTAPRWTVSFVPAPALVGADWRRVVLDPGRTGAAYAEPGALRREGRALLWAPGAGTYDGDGHPLTAGIDPPFPRALAAQSSRPWHIVLSDAGGLLWPVALVAFVLLALGRAPRGPSGQSLEPVAVRNLRHALWLMLLLRALAGLGSFWLLGRDLHGTGNDPPELAAFGMASTAVAGGLLFAFGRPGRGPLVTAGLLLVPPLAVSVGWPTLVGQDRVPDLQPGLRGDLYVALLAVAVGCVVVLGFAGLAVAIWRLAAEGGLVPPVPPGTLVRRTALTATAATVVVAACYAYAAEWDWRRASWLSDPAAAASEHARNGAYELAWAAARFHDWWLGLDWLLPGVAMLGVLRLGGRTWRGPGQAPRGRDRRLLLAVFGSLVALGVGWYANSALLVACWLLLNIGALHLLTRRARRGVLDLPLEGTSLPLRAALTVGHRAVLLDRARLFRDVHARLRRLDQGQQSADGLLRRRPLENALERLHAWPPGASTALPRHLTVVDAALALGPYDTWWDNGVRAARTAHLAGVPLSVLLVWADLVRGDRLTGALGYNFALPDLLLTFGLWQLAWATGGFVLGALWCELPGRRGPVKALVVATAYALPVGLFAVGNWLVDEEQDNLALFCAAMLLVLTVTGIALDVDTFRSERRFWQTRYGMLLSVYQMRYVSLQLAYLLTQVTVFITLWEFLADTGGGSPGKGPGAS
ncbi:DUF6185 family protein [Streptomyces sp. NPDC001941]|uniref:DUF6185 family protein n=1 Tax=Streptomyces sp. NPDC001941 TaxID=3154659 RepID=UPI00332ECC3A